MQSSITEILRLVADGVVRPEEGQELLSALRTGFPEEFDLPVAARSPAPAQSGLPPESPVERTDGQSVLGAGVGSSGSDGSTDVADPWPGTSPHQPGATPPDPKPSDVHAGESVEVPAGILLRINATDAAQSTDAHKSSVALRGVTDQVVRVVRGSGVELHKEEDAAWRLTWPGGLLFLEIPARLAGLEIRGIPGSVGLSGYAGPFSGEEIGGGFTVHGASAPFRIREVAGTVQLHHLALREGIATIAAVGKDVEIETANEASVTIRASSRPQLPEGVSDFDARGEADPDHAGRRGVWRVGAGTAQLNVSQIRGQLRLHPIGTTMKDVP